MCPYCNEDARFLGWRGRDILTAVGSITLKAAYYHCSHCHHGHKPWEKILGLKSGVWTPRASVNKAPGASVRMAGIPSRKLLRLDRFEKKVLH